MSPLQDRMSSAPSGDQIDDRQFIVEISRSKRGIVSPDEKDLQDYRVIDLRNPFAIVPQEIQLFSTTIAESVRYGNLQATDAQAVAAAKAAQADQFICALPEQYDTLWVNGAPDCPADGSGLHWRAHSFETLRSSSSTSRPAPSKPTPKPPRSIPDWTFEEVPPQLVFS